MGRLGNKIGLILSVGIGISATIAAAARFWPVPPMQAATPCMDAGTIESLRSLAFVSLDNAFSAQIEHLYEIWMKDDTPDQAQRVARGTERAIRAYVHGQVAIRKWQPSCR